MTGGGISVKRLRAVSIPNSDYERYELEAGYRPGVLAGEDIRVCERNKIDGRFLISGSSTTSISRCLTTTNPVQ